MGQNNSIKPVSSLNRPVRTVIVSSAEISAADQKIKAISPYSVVMMNLPLWAGNLYKHFSVPVIVVSNPIAAYQKSHHQRQNSFNHVTIVPLLPAQTIESANLGQGARLIKIQDPNLIQSLNKNILPSPTKKYQKDWYLVPSLISNQGWNREAQDACHESITRIDPRATGLNLKTAEIELLKEEVKNSLFNSPQRKDIEIGEVYTVPYIHRERTESRKINIERNDLVTVISAPRNSNYLAVIPLRIKAPKKNYRALIDFSDGCGKLYTKRYADARNIQTIPVDALNDYIGLNLRYLDNNNVSRPPFQNLLIETRKWMNLPSEGIKGGF